MTRAWRIVKAIHASTAFDGEGAWRFGGRWNSPGTRVVYCSANLSLAALENLVHLNPPVAFKSVAIGLEFHDRLIETVDAKSLPADWTEEPPPPSTMEIGDRWVKEGRSAVLQLPSAIIPSESNYLLNPSHRDFQKITIRKPAAFSFDPRLV
jgi:RES domain-containing protein